MGKQRVAKRESEFERTILLAVVCNSHTNLAWKTKKDEDGNNLNGQFLAGVRTKEGQFALLCDMSDWALFDVSTINQSPKLDDTGKRAIYRLFNLVDVAKDIKTKADRRDHSA